MLIIRKDPQCLKALSENLSLMQKSLWRFWITLTTLLTLLVGIGLYGFRLSQQPAALLSEQTQTLSRLMVRQLAQTSVYWLDNPTQLTQWLTTLAQEPLILDATVYDLKGQTLGQSPNALEIKALTGFATPLDTAKQGRQQLIEPIYSQENKVLGFFRLTLEQRQILLPAHQQQSRWRQHWHWMMLMLVITGGLLMTIKNWAKWPKMSKKKRP
jgi:membrane protein